MGAAARNEVLDNIMKGDELISSSCSYAKA